MERDKPVYRQPVLSQLLKSLRAGNYPQRPTPATRVPGSTAANPSGFKTILSTATLSNSGTTWCSFSPMTTSWPFGNAPLSSLRWLVASSGSIAIENDGEEKSQVAWASIDWLAQVSERLASYASNK